MYKNISTSSPKLTIIALVVWPLLFLQSNLSYSSDKSNLRLNGAFLYQENGIDHHIGALYLETETSDPVAILNSNQEQVMQIVVMDNRWRKRQWKRFWRNHIKINNDGIAPTQSTSRLLGTFTRLVHDELNKDDEVEVHFLNNKTLVKLNGLLVVESEGKQAFNMLLNTWLGQVPPSTAFKKGLLNGASGKHWKIYQATLPYHQPREQRKNIYANWNEKLEKQKLIANTSKPQPSKPKSISKTVTVNKKLPATSLTEDLNEEKIVAQNAKKVTTEKLKDKVATQKEIKAQETIAKETKLASNPSEEIVTEDIETLTAETPLAASLESSENYFSQLAQWHIQRYVNRRVEYPYWAKNFQEEGLVYLGVTIAEDKTVVIENRDMDADEMFVKEVENKIRNAVEAMALPATATFPIQTDIQYNFTLNNLPQKEPEMPDLPKNLASASQLQWDSVEKYKYEIMEKVKSEIEMPGQAEILKKRGRVVASFSIDRNGNVVAESFPVQDRFKPFNIAVAKAIQQAQPFPLPPITDSAGVVEIVLEHKFR